MLVVFNNVYYMCMKNNEENVRRTEWPLLCFSRGQINTFEGNDEK